MVANRIEHAVIFGAGALGSWLGARLTVPATLVARGEHARAMAARGLKIAGVEDDLVAVTVSKTCPSLEPHTLLLVTVKVTDLPDAADAVRDRLRDDTLIAVVANGLAPDASFGAALDRHVVRIVSEFGATLDGPGVVSAWGGRALLGPGAEEDVVADSLATTGLRIDRVDDLHRIAWEKLILNCVANPLAALTGRRNRELVTDELAGLRRAVVEEASRIAALDGADMPDDLATRIDALLSRSHNLNSMAQDMLRGRPTEIDHLNGFIADRAAALGVPAPVNRWLAEMVRLRSTAGGADG